MANQTLPIMPKATAVWLVDNTALTFDQIANFCGMHALEVQGIADGEVAIGIIGEDPIASGQLTADDIKACEEDPSRSLQMKESARQHMQQKQKGGRYTPVARRRDKPDAIAWLTKHHPELKDAQIVKLVGTTKKTIEAIRTRSHWNMSNINPRDPVLLGLCTQIDLDKAVSRARLNSPKEESSEPAPQSATS